MPLSRLTTSSFTPNGITLKDISTAPSQLNGIKNLLINGDFRVWQRGTDLNPATTGNGITSVDRWTNQYVDFSPRIRKVQDTINGETVDTVEITKNSGTYASCELTQKVETNVAKYLRGQTVTFSFWIKKVGATLGSHQYDCWIGDSETDNDTGWTNSRTYDRGRYSRPSGMSSAVVFTSTGVWQKIKITRTLSADTNTIYCTVYTSNTPVGEGIRVAKCQLEIGTVDTDFERRPYGLEYDMCLRYFRFNPPLQGNFRGDGGNGFIAAWGDCISRMRSTPTVTIVNGTSAIHASNVSNYNANSLTDTGDQYLRVNTNASPASWGGAHFYANVASMNSEF
jgi:hypothetical protein